MTTDATTTALRRCIGSAKFGIEAHEAPPDEFPAQPSQKDGLGRMCKPHWSQYTSALRKAALARKAAEAGRPSRSPSRRPSGSGPSAATYPPSMHSTSDRSAVELMVVEREPGRERTADCASCGRRATLAQALFVGSMGEPCGVIDVCDDCAPEGGPDRRGSGRCPAARMGRCSPTTEALSLDGSPNNHPWAPGASAGPLSVRSRRRPRSDFIAARGPTWVPTGEPRRMPDRPPG